MRCAVPALSVFLAATLPVSAATLTVTSIGNSGPGSLREAVAAAGPGDLIDFSPSLAGSTISLDGSIEISTDVIVDATAAPGVAVSGSDVDRVFVIAGGSSVEIRGLRIVHGVSSDFDGGGAIDNQGQLLLVSCSLEDNVAVFGGAIDTDGDLTLMGCALINNEATDSGGAIYNLSGTLTIQHSTLTNNLSALDGGAIMNEDGVVSAENTTIADNRSNGDGGGIAIIGSGSGGGLVHTTITGNEAGGSGGGIRLTNGICHLENSIIADNRAGRDSDISKESVTGNPTLTASGGNLIGDNSSAQTELPGGPTIGTPSLPLRPFLAPLARYRSNLPTCPPLPGSPAISTATTTSSSPQADQHGVPRPVRALADLGAVEAFLWKDLPKADTDADGIDDRIEPAYNLVVGVDDSLADSDGDGQRDSLEIDSMTNPADRGSLLAIQSFELLDPDTRAFRMMFASFPGLTYSAEGDQSLTFKDPGVIVLDSVVANSFQSELHGVMRPHRDFVRLVRE